MLKEKKINKAKINNNKNSRSHELYVVEFKLPVPKKKNNKIND